MSSGCRRWNTGLRRSPRWSPSPLLSHQELKAVIPAVNPSARHWLREVDAGARCAAAQQRTLQEMGRHVVRTEEARDATEAKNAHLRRMLEQQSVALVASTARCASLRQGYERQRAELLQQTERSRLLERGLRAMAREQAASRSRRPHRRRRAACPTPVARGARRRPRAVPAPGCPGSSAPAAAAR